MGYEIWFCEGLVVVFLTETCHRIAVVSEREARKATRGDVYADGRSSRSTRVPKNSFLDCSQQEFKYTEARGV